MHNPNTNSLPFVLLLLTFSFHAAASGGPLHTSSRWIVDGSGRRVKLACVNWPAHLEVATAEGLSHQPVDKISKQIVGLGMNCVRLTWATYLVTNGTVTSTTVRQSFESNGLGQHLPGLQANNPSLLDLPLIKAFQAVVQNLAQNNLMVILDNHVSVPGWCCSSTDGNGFFGDQYFDPEVWLRGLQQMATLFKNTPNVVAMSLRNELRGPNQNADAWYRYMQRGAEVVHAANPNVLIILSGLNFDLDLSFLKTRPISVTFAASHKIAFEVHWYSFSGGGGSWTSQNPNDVCGAAINDKTNKAMFLLDQGWPLILTEFGGDLTGKNEDDNRFFICMLGVLAELDLDHAYWEIGGSYYRRNNVIDLNETYGLLSRDWTRQNIPFLIRLAAIQAPFQGPGVGRSTSMHQIIFHPLSGKCIVRKSKNSDLLMLGSCSESDAWVYNAEKGTLAVSDGTVLLYLQAQGQQNAVKLVKGSTSGLTWKQISSSKMHLSSELNGGVQVCLEVGNQGDVITEQCKCLSQQNNCNPVSQWFKIINTSRTVRSHTTNMGM